MKPIYCCICILLYCLAQWACQTDDLEKVERPTIEIMEPIEQYLDSAYVRVIALKKKAVFPIIDTKLMVRLEGENYVEFTAVETEGNEEELKFEGGIGGLELAREYTIKAGILIENENDGETNWIYDSVDMLMTGNLVINSISEFDKNPNTENRVVGLIGEITGLNNFLGGELDAHGFQWIRTWDKQVVDDVFDLLSITGMTDKGQISQDGPFLDIDLEMDCGYYYYIRPYIVFRGDTIPGPTAVYAGHNCWVLRDTFVGNLRPPALYDAVGFSLDNKGYVGTGVNEFDEVTDEFWCYHAHPSDNFWEMVAPYPDSVKSATFFVDNNMAYVGAGDKSEGAEIRMKKQFYSFDGTGWTSMPTLPKNMTENTGFALDGYGYIGAGLTDTFTFNPFGGDTIFSSKGNYNFYKLDLLSGMTWEVIDSFPSFIETFQLESPPSFTLYDQTAFVLTPRSTSLPGETGLSVFSLAALEDQWMENPNHHFDNNSKNEALGFTVGKRGYIATGRTGTQKDWARRIFSFDPERQDPRWHRHHDMPEGAGVHKASGFVIDGRIYIYGGRLTENDQPTNQLWVYTPDLTDH